MYLNTHSYYSLRYGAMSTEEVVAAAKQRGVGRLALTDINNSSGIIDFVRECRQQEVEPVAGMEFRNGDELLFVALARNNEGFREINEYRSKYNFSKEPVPEKAPPFRDVYVVYPFAKAEKSALRDNERVGVAPWEVFKLYSSAFRDDLSKVVVMHPVVFENRQGFELHQNLRAVAKNTLITKLQPGQTAHEEAFFWHPDRLQKVFEGYPQVVYNTEKLLADCHIDFDFKTLKNKKTFTSSRYNDKLLLEKLARDGFKSRYGNHPKAKKRMEEELQVIDNLGFAAYFLITWDIIRYSMSRGFYHVGRGSGANSIVAYCLRITDVDPVELNLYFERFINPRRSSPPDFDIDYSWTDRDEVTEYIFNRYGQEHTALLGTMTTFKGKSIYRELGKVHGLPKGEIDRLVEQPVAEDDSVVSHIQHVGNQMVDFPNIRSIHAGGILISEEPITSYTALDMPPKGFPTTQWDMYVAEDINFEKLDILSQRGIGHIKEAAVIIEKNKGEKVDVHDIPRFKKDERVKRLLKTGETNGCFYIESPAMRGLLKKLQCEDYITLVAASSIIRPGVAKSGMMKEYIRRFHHPDSFDYLHPVMKEQLEETFGVMVFQEDVLKVCHHYADLDLADADILRRAMSGKYRSKNEFQRIVDKFFENSKSKGYSEETTREIWRQIESFAGYSFSKAHSASYAVESFQSLYLKAYYPREFMVAVINNFGGFYRSWVYFNEARRWGANIELPCVNHSQFKTSIKGHDVYIGLVHLANLEKKLAQRMVEERDRNGVYASLEDFVRRLPVHLEQIKILIRIGAFRFTGRSKSDLLWHAHMLLSDFKGKDPSEMALFSLQEKHYELPRLEQSEVSDVYDEIELLGFAVTKSMFEMLKTRFRGEVMARQMNDRTGQKVRMLGNLVTIKYVRTVKKDYMNFGTFVDVHGEFFDTVHFSASLKKYPFRGYGIYLLYGKIVEEFGYASLEVEKMAKMPVVGDPRG